MVRWQHIGWRAALLMYLTVAAFLVAHTVNGFVSAALYIPLDSRMSTGTPALVSGHGTKPSRYVTDILESGLFPLPLGGSEAGQFLAGGVGAVAASPLDAARKINVVGTVVGDREGVLAVIEEITSKRQALYRLHDLIPNVGELAEIRHNAVLIRQGFQEEWVDLSINKQIVPPGAEPGTVVPARSTNQALHRILDRREVAQVTADLPKLLTQARAVPYTVNGKLEGYKIDNITPQSFFDRLGLRVGDVLQRVNGVEIRDPGTMLTLFQQVKNERSVQLDVLRENLRTSLTYDIR
jgi:general secretion pathway protein C